MHYTGFLDLLTDQFNVRHKVFNVYKDDVQNLVYGIQDFHINDVTIWNEPHNYIPSCRVYGSHRDHKFDFKGIHEFIKITRDIYLGPVRPTRKRR